MANVTPDYTYEDHYWEAQAHIDLLYEELSVAEAETKNEQFENKRAADRHLSCIERITEDIDKVLTREKDYING